MISFIGHTHTRNIDKQKRQQYQTIKDSHPCVLSVGTTLVKVKLSNRKAFWIKGRENSGGIYVTGDEGSN